MAHSHALKAVHSDMPGGWEGGSLTALRDVIRQTCTIGRMAVIYTTLAIVGYNIFSYSHYLQYGGVEMVAVHRLGVDSGTFTCIEGSAQRHAWGLGGWIADRPPRCY